MDPGVKTIQPGGGIVMQIELGWGKVRRGLLRVLRPGYVKRMQQLRLGEQGDCPIDPIDPRDVKYYRNQNTYHWAPEHDRFQWRNRLPFVREGLCELLLIGGLFALLTAAAAWFWWPAAIAPGVIMLLVIWFFRDPRRVIPDGPGQVVSPADGKVVLIETIDDPLIGEAVLIGIFLSIFNVHANRSPVAGKVIGISYRKGKFLNALRPESARENEQLELRVQQPEAPFRLMRVRQITGAIARRIVCYAGPGDQLGRGEMFGMIKLGSRTELVLPKEASLDIHVSVGDTIKAGSSLIATYNGESKSEEEVDA